MHEAKLEAQKQWNTEPCGAISAAGLEEDSIEYFETIKAQRYKEYAPWMEQAIRFDRFCDKKVLEIGPGVGTDLLQFASHRAHTYAIDLSKRHLELTRRNLGLHRYVTPCILADAELLPFRSEIFDCVYAFGVFHHTPNVELAIEEVRRVLRRGGKAIVGLYHRDSAFYWVYTILIRGLWRMDLFKKGYRRLMSEIEHRSAGSDALPLVKVYSRGQTRRLFRSFRRTRIQTYHLEYSHFNAAGLAKRILPLSWQRREWIEGFSRHCGWFVMVEAEK